MIKKLASLMLICLLTGSAFAQKQEVKNNIIDIRMKSCLDSTENQTTMGMMDCVGRARDSWDGELNKSYKLLMSILTSEEKEKLKIAQKNWLLYRDAEFSFSNTVYYDQEGTLWRIVAVNRQLEIVKARAIELANYYKSLTENN